MAMTEMHGRLLDRFYEKRLGADWKRTAGPLHLTGWQVVEALWPMNDVFRPRLSRIRSLSYSKAEEAAADRAVAAYVLGTTWTDADPTPLVWRILLERHTQSILLALANEHAGNSRLVTVPDTLDKRFHLQAAMLFLQYQMALPFPVPATAQPLWPEGPPPASLRQH